MPTGPFKDFAACEVHFSKDPHVDDPAKLCGYIEERTAKGDLQPGDKIIYGLDVQYMSIVDSPAVDSVFLKAKDRDGVPIMQKKDTHGRQMKCKSYDSATTRGMFLKSELDEKNFVVKAVALIPHAKDGNGEALSDEEIYKAAVKYMEYRKVDDQHDFKDGKGYPVFNWILEKETEYELMDGKRKSYPKGTWLTGLKVTDPKEWEDIKDGKRRGFSIAGYWSAVEIKSTNNDRPQQGEENNGTVKRMDEKDKKEFQEMLNELSKKSEEGNKTLLEAITKSNADAQKNYADVMAKTTETSTKSLTDAFGKFSADLKALLTKEDEKAEEEEDEDEDEEEEKEEKPEDEEEEEEKSRKPAPDPKKAKKKAEEPTIEDEEMEERQVLHRTSGAKKKNWDNEEGVQMKAQDRIASYKSKLEVKVESS